MVLIEKNYAVRTPEGRLMNAFDAPHSLAYNLTHNTTGWLELTQSEAEQLAAIMGVGYEAVDTTKVNVFKS